MSEPLTTEQKAEALRVTLASRGWQDVIKPALKAAIDTAIEAWSTGKRPEGDTTSDDGLRNRVIALRWVLDWESTYDVLINQLEAIQKVRDETPPPRKGGSPYD